MCTVCKKIWVPAIILITAAVNIGDNCRTDDQCDGIDEAICETGKCICRRGFHAYNNICWKDVALRSSCQTASECVIRPDLQDRVNCTEGICACAAGYLYSEVERTCESHASIQTSTWILTAALSSLILLYNK